MNAILISGGNWNGGQIQATPRSRIKSIQVKSRGGVGGRVRGPVLLIVDCLEKLTAGDVLKSFRTTSQRGCVFPATNVLELLNPPVGNDSILQIDQLIDLVKIRTV